MGGPRPAWGSQNPEGEWPCSARGEAYHDKITLIDLPSAFKALVEAANASLLTAPTGAHPFGRRTVFARNEKNALNAIKKLDTPFAAHFRYFWLELLSTPEAVEKLGTFFSTDKLLSLRDDARVFYYEYLEAEASKSIKSLNPALDEKKLKERAVKSASDQMRKALERWFGISATDFATWKASPKTAEVAVAVESSESPTVDAESTEPLSAEEDESVEDLLKDLSV